MDLRQMQYFLCLAAEKNVTRAARQLNIVQPALSMQIAKLEAELGQKLFDRNTHGMTATAAGERLAQLVAPILRDVEYAAQEMARLKGQIAGHVSVGLINSVAQSTMATSSASVSEKYPDVTLSVYDGYTETLMEWITSGQLDFAIINVPRRRLALSTHHILDEEMVFACRRDAALAIPGKLRFEDVARFDLVLPSKRHGLRMTLERDAAEVGVELKPRLELDTLSALCDVIATTELVTVLPTIALHRHLADGRLRAHRFAAPRVTRSIAWVHHPRRLVSPAARAVVDVIRGDLAKAASSASQYVRPASETHKAPRGRSTSRAGR